MSRERTSCRLRLGGQRVCPSQRGPLWQNSVSDAPRGVLKRTTHSISARSRAGCEARSALPSHIALTYFTCSAPRSQRTHPSHVLFFFVCTFLQLTSHTKGVCSTALAAPPSPPELKSTSLFLPLLLLALPLKCGELCCCAE
jgi:hypothetical protein